MRDLVLNGLTFAYEGTDRPLFRGLGVTFPPGWTGIVGPNGCGKSTLMKILAGELRATAGTIDGEFPLVHYCVQDTHAPPGDWEEFCDSYDKEAIRLKTSLGLHELLGRDWEQLSHGERKRFQLGCALIRVPDLLLVDEPTNHLDAPNRAFLIETLQTFKGVGIMVSHDRELLNALARQCLFFDGGSFVPLAGNYDETRAAVEAMHSNRLKRAESLEHRARSMGKEVERLAALDRASAKRLSKRNIAKGDHDAKTKIDAARLTSKDASLGRRKAQLESRVEEVKEELRRLQGTKDYSGSIFFENPTSKSKLLLHMLPGSMPLPDGTRLHIPELVLKSGDKVGLVGPNGAGKSSFLQHLAASDAFRTDMVLYLRQEIPPAEVERINAALASTTKEDYARCLQIVARLGSDAKQVLRSDHRSPGEVRKIAIALAIVGGYDLLILDEPTNHLDLPSIERLEEALAGCPLALVLVSHDGIFIDATCETLWKVGRRADGDSELVVD